MKTTMRTMLVVGALLLGACGTEETQDQEPLASEEVGQSIEAVTGSGRCETSGAKGETGYCINSVGCVRAWAVSGCRVGGSNLGSPTGMCSRLVDNRACTY